MSACKAVSRVDVGGATVAISVCLDCHEKIHPHMREESTR